MKKYIIPFFVYILIPLVLDPYLSKTISYTIQTIATAFLLIWFYKHYNLKFRLGFYPILFGIAIFLLWILLAPLAHIGESAYIPVSVYSIIIKLIGFIVIAPFIEELFVRDFLIRLIHGGKEWQTVKIGTYSLSSFIITVLFFGFSHTLWLAGLASGIMFNLLLYKTRRIDACIQAHMAVNFILAIYVLYTGQWMLW